MGNLKHTTKRDLMKALDAAQAEINRLAGENATRKDAGLFLSKELDRATEGLKAATDQVAQLTSQVKDYDGQNTTLATLNQELQAQLTEAKNLLADLEAVGITQDVVDSPVNLSALRRLLDASEAGEPVFVLRARDRVAPQVVEWWASEAVKAGVTNHRKLGQALARAAEMRRWAENHGNRIPD